MLISYNRNLDGIYIPTHRPSRFGTTVNVTICYQLSLIGSVKTLRVSNNFRVFHQSSNYYSITFEEQK